jgi:hypothetical protein
MSVEGMSQEASPIRHRVVEQDAPTSDATIKISQNHEQTLTP